MSVSVIHSSHLLDPLIACPFPRCAEGDGADRQTDRQRRQSQVDAAPSRAAAAAAARPSGMVRLVASRPSAPPIRHTPSNAYASFVCVRMCCACASTTSERKAKGKEGSATRQPSPAQRRSHPVTIAKQKQQQTCKRANTNGSAWRQRIRGSRKKDQTMYGKKRNTSIRTTMMRGSPSLPFSRVRACAAGSRPKGLTASRSSCWRCDLGQRLVLRARFLPLPALRAAGCALPWSAFSPSASSPSFCRTSVLAVIAGWKGRRECGGHQRRCPWPGQLMRPRQRTSRRQPRTRQKNFASSASAWLART